MRDRRRCAACGVGLPAEASRCPTCGHVEGDPVVAGHDGTDARTGRRGRRPVLIALVVVAGVVAALAVVDRRSSTGDGGAAADDRATTTTGGGTSTSGRRGTPTTPPDRSFVSTIPLPEGVRLMGWLSSGWGEILDPATGMIASTRIASGSEFVQVVPRLGGAVVVNPGDPGGGVARWYPQLPAPDGLPPLESNVTQAFASDVPARVWLVRGLENPVLVEIDLTTGQVVDELELPSNAGPAGAVDGGLVIAAPGGLFRYRRGEDRFERLASGEFVASAGGRLAYRSCDERLVCPISVRDLDDETDTVLEPSIGAEGHVMNSVMSPDGRWLAVVLVEPAAGSRIVVYDVVTGASFPVRSGPARTAQFIQPSWTSDGEWLLYPDFPGIRGFNPADNAATTLDTDGAPYQGVAVLEPPGAGAGAG